MEQQPATSATTTTTVVLTRALPLGREPDRAPRRRVRLRPGGPLRRHDEARGRSGQRHLDLRPRAARRGPLRPLRRRRRPGVALPERHRRGRRHRRAAAPPTAPRCCRRARAPCRRFVTSIFDAVPAGAGERARSTSTHLVDPAARRLSPTGPPARPLSISPARFVTVVWRPSPRPFTTEPRGPAMTDTYIFLIRENDWDSDRVPARRRTRQPRRWPTRSARTGLPGRRRRARRPHRRRRRPAERQARRRRDPRRGRRPRSRTPSTPTAPTPTPAS